MSHDLICSWLGLPPGGWPPDHYRLLGLEPGESNAELIEQRVHQRLDSVRRYQMMHPEQATEAMNRLAQAFVCLTEPTAKKMYDAMLLGKAAPAENAPGPAEEESPAPEEAGEARDPLAWLYSPGALREETVSTLPPPAAPPPLPAVPPPLPPEWVGAPPEAAPPPAPEPLVVPMPPPPPEPLDPVVEAAQTSRQARRGLGTKRALYYRVARTRHLLRLWGEIGKYLASPTRGRLRTAEAADLLRHLAEIETTLQDFPPLMGEAGQPGYLVLALSQMSIVKTFQTLSPSQREALSRDWNAGHKFLTAHRDFLRGELRALRHRSWWNRLVGPARSFFTDRPVVALLLLLALVALNVALWRTYVEDLWQMFRH